MKTNTLFRRMGVLALVLGICACGAFWGLVLLRSSTQPTKIEHPTPSETALGTSSPTTIPITMEALTPAKISESQPENLSTPPLTETLTMLQKAVVPVHDPFEMVNRLEGKSNLPRSLEFPPTPLALGARETFWATNNDTNENFEVNAYLAYTTPHVYFWIAEDIRYNEDELAALVETFEHHIYPTTRRFFGSEWTPGVDGDEHLYILYTRGVGRNVAGYYSTTDEYLPILRPNSNSHEMFILNADHLSLDETYTYGILAHEFQHMIHWNLDRNEETWMNEGFSNLAMFVNGYAVGGSDRIYARQPDIQLTYWPVESHSRAANYGAAYLFLNYFLDRFGEEATRMLVADAANGMESVNRVLESLHIYDALRERPLTANDFFADWIIANFLQDAKILDGRFAYHHYPNAPKVRPTESIHDCPITLQPFEVSQYGADYIEIQCQGKYELQFSGAPQVRFLPVEPHSGEYYFFSNRGDEADTTLTKTFDFRDYEGTLTLTYWTWYDLEKDYDYAYLMASLDGERWHILSTPSGTPSNPAGNSYGWAYNGKSGDGPMWIREEVDISQFSGKVVHLRFEVITDAGVSGEGFLLDDISIPQIGYFTDFEDDTGGWKAEGFVRIRNLLPQYFQIILISFGEETKVIPLTLLEGNQANIPLELGKEVRTAVLIVAGTTPFTREKAQYHLSILPLP